MGKPSKEHHARINEKTLFHVQVVGLKLWIMISYMGTGNLCVVYETTVGTPIFSYFLNKFSYFFLFVLSKNFYFPVFLSNVTLDTLSFPQRV